MRVEDEKAMRPVTSNYRGLSTVLVLLGVLTWGLVFLLRAVSEFLTSISGGNLSDGLRRVFPNSEFSSSRKRLTFADVRDGKFKPTLKELQWIHSPDSITNDQGTYLLTVKEDESTSYVVKSILDGDYHYTLFNSSGFSYNGSEYTIETLTASPDLKKAVLKTNNTKGWRHSSTALYWTLSVDESTIEPVHDETQKLSVTSWSPNSDAIAFVLENDVYVKNLTLQTTHRITSDGSADIFNGKPDWVYEEEVFALDITLWWSPCGDKLAFLKFNDTQVPEFAIPYYVQKGHEDYPEIVTIKYPKPGYENPTVEVAIADLGSENVQVHAADIPSLNNTLITEVLWVSDDSVFVKTTNRASDKMEVYLASADAKGQAKLIRTHHAKDSWFEVTSNALFVPKNESLGRPLDGYIDLVVHDGFNHLAYFSPPDHPTPRLLTQGKWEVLSNTIDLQQNVVYFSATLDLSVERHIYKIDLLDPSSEPERITTADGWNKGSFSSGSRFLLHSYLGPYVPAQSLIDLHEGKIVKNIETNQDLRQTVAEFALPKSNISVTNLGLEDEPVLANFVEILPPNFDPSKKYPVLFYVYGGPGSQMVTTGFSVDFSQVVASTLGAIVVTVDGRGTGFNNYNHNGAEFKFCVRDQLGKFEPEDQIAAAKIWAAKEYVDEARIAIWGWSYGGFLTLKTLESDTDHVFSYGVAVAPVTQWRLYDSIYTERYLRTPQENPKGYETASIHDVENFKGVTRFLVMHGSGDDNVHFQNSLRLVDDFNLASVENFDFMVFPDSDHLIRYHNGNTVVFDRILGWLRRAFSLEFHDEL